MYNKKRLTLFIRLPRCQFVIENNMNASCKNMEIVKYGSLMHGWWVGVWLLPFSQQLLSDFWHDFHDLDGAFWLRGLMKVVASCLLEILQLESCHLDFYNSRYAKNTAPTSS